MTAVARTTTIRFLLLLGLVAAGVGLVPAGPAAEAQDEPPARLQPAWQVPGMSAPYYLHPATGGGVLVAGYGGGAVLALASEVVWRYADGTTTVDAAFGDVNGDGVDDVALGQWLTGVTLLDGRDGAVLARLPTPATPSAVAIGDATGDGQVDLYVVLTGSSAAQTEVRLYDGDGFALVWAVGVGANEGQAMNAEAGDLDDDGRADVVFGTYSAGARAHAFAPDGTRHWAVDLGGTVSRVRIADGGRTVFATRTGAELVALDGATGAARWRLPAVGGYSRLHVADLDGDGGDDAVWGMFGLTGASPSNQVRGVDGSTGVPLWTWAPGHGAKAVAVGDMDGDGAVEVALGTQDVIGTQSQRVNVVQLLEGATGAHRWTRTFASEADTAISDLVAADGDSDGRPELVIAPYTDVLLGVSGTAGEDRWSRPLGSSVVEMVAADLDADGAEEVLAATDDFAVTVHDARTGAARWRRALDTDVLGLQTVDGGAGGTADVLALTLSALYRLDGGTGAVVWQHRLQGWGLAVLPVDPDQDGASDVLVSARLPRVLHGLGRVVADTMAGSLELLDGRSGAARWSVQTPGAAARLLGGDLNADGRPDVVASTALAQTGIVAYDGARLATAPLELWRHDAGTNAAAVHVESGRVLAVLPASRAVVGIDGADGSQDWRTDVDSQGMRLLGEGDADGDGRTDLFVGAGLWGDRLVAVSGRDGAQLSSHDLAAAGLRFPDAAVLGEMTGDGVPDLLVAGTAAEGWMVAYDGALLNEHLVPRRVFGEVEVRAIVPVRIDGSTAFAVSGPTGAPAVLALIPAP